MGMGADVALVIATVVTGFVQVVKAFVGDSRTSLLAAVILSLIGTLAYAVSFEEAFHRILIWKYFTAFGTVSGTAIGIHQIAQKSTEKVQNVIQSRRDSNSGNGGTGNGTGNGN